MDAVECLKTKRRLCEAHTGCRRCPLNSEECGYAIGCPCGELERENVEELVRRVEKWAKEHPVETRQSRFLKEFPNAMRTKEGAIRICPKSVDTGMKCGDAGCEECEQKYWSEGIYDE